MNKFNKILACSIISMISLGANAEMMKWSFDSTLDSESGMVGSDPLGSNFVEDRFGNTNSAVSLDKSLLQYVDVDSGTGLGVMTDFTFSMWFKTDEIIGRNYLMDGRNNGNPGSTNMYIIIDDEGATQEVTAFGREFNAVVEDNIWHNLIFTANIAENKSYIYFDDQLVSDSTASTSTIGFDGGFILGQYNQMRNYAFNGSIDDVIITNEFSSAEQASILMASSASLNASASVPLPATMSLLGLGLVGFTLRKKKSK